MFNTSFLQIVIVLVFVFLLFGDFPKLLTNLQNFKRQSSAKNNCDTNFMSSLSLLLFKFKFA